MMAAGIYPCGRTDALPLPASALPCTTVKKAYSTQHCRLHVSAQGHTAACIYLRQCSRGRHPHTASDHAVARHLAACMRTARMCVSPC